MQRSYFRDRDSGEVAAYLPPTRVLSVSVFTLPGKLIMIEIYIAAAADVASSSQTETLH